MVLGLVFREVRIRGSDFQKHFFWVMREAELGIFAVRETGDRSRGLGWSISGRDGVLPSRNE